MSKLQELNKELSAAQMLEASDLEVVFSKYIKEHIATFRDLKPSDYKYLNDGKNKKDRKIMTRQIAEICASSLENLFDIADSLKKMKTSLKKKGYIDLRAEFTTCWDETFLEVFVDREESDEEYNVRMEKSRVARKNAKAKKDKELEDLKKLAAKKGYSLQKKS